MIDVTTITVAQFKAQFFRGFPYLQNYDDLILYNSGDEVYYPTNKLFYTAQCDGTIGITPSTDETKWVKTIDDLDNWVQDRDIENAFLEAQSVFNIGLYQSDATINLAYLYLTAHFLCHDLKAAQAGLMASGNFPASSKGAGSISESYSIPQRYMDSPVLSQYTSSAYGMKFLAMTLPNLTGNVVTVAGATLP